MNTNKKINFLTNLIVAKEALVDSRSTKEGFGMVKSSNFLKRVSRITART